MTVRKTVRNLWQVVMAFVRLSFRQALSYPLRFGLGQASQFIPIVIFYFVARVFDRPDSAHGGDYFTFVVIGLIGTRLLDAGLRGLSQEFDQAINRGWLEMFLVEPVRWRFMPFAMSMWPISSASIGAMAMFGISVALGAQYAASGLGAALLVGVLGLLAGLSIATLAASVAVLSKSGDPVLYLYTLAAQIFSGVYFNVELLPGPLKALSYVIPHTYVIQGLRVAVMPGGAELPGFSVPEVVVALVIFCAVMYPTSLWIYGRALEFGRKLGVLSGY